MEAKGTGDEHVPSRQEIDKTVDLYLAQLSSDAKDRGLPVPPSLTPNPPAVTSTAATTAYTLDQSSPRKSNGIISLQSHSLYHLCLFC